MGEESQGNKKLFVMGLGEKRKRVLVCVGSYLPGYKTGGPNRSIANMVAHLADRFDFFVITRDRDITDSKCYPDVTSNKWCKVGNAQVLYCSSVNPWILLRAFREVMPDVVYLNSFQDAFTRVMVALRRVGAFGNTPMLLAPRGEFSPGAMKIRQAKKFLYRHLTKILRFHENMLWHVSTPKEQTELIQAAPTRRLDPDTIFIAYNVAEATSLLTEHPRKSPGTAKFVYISRISEMKNLHFLLGIVRELCGHVEICIYGPVAGSDAAYWRRCKSLMAEFSGNIKADYRGPIDHGAVPKALHDHHFFVLPTKGENFCHAAVESFINGTPVVLSDETPWLNLREMHAGFDISLKDREGWIAALQMCIDMDQPAYTMYLNGAKEYSRRFAAEELARQSITMFEAAMRVRPVTHVAAE